MTNIGYSDNNISISLLDFHQSWYILYIAIISNKYVFLSVIYINCKYRYEFEPFINI